MPVNDPTADERERIERELDSFLTTALSIYDVMKAVPHPYNAVADMTNHWAHDFVGFAFRVKSALGDVAAERERADRLQRRIDAAPHAQGCPAPPRWPEYRPVTCDCWKSEDRPAATPEPPHLDPEPMIWSGGTGMGRHTLTDRCYLEPVCTFDPREHDEDGKPYSRNRADYEADR